MYISEKRIPDHNRANTLDIFFDQILFILKKTAYANQVFEVNGLAYLKNKKRPYSGYWIDPEKGFEGEYRYGKKHGQWKESYFHERYPSSSKYQLIAKGNYFEGRKEGQWEEYWQNEKLILFKRKGKFRRGKKDGLWVEWQWNEVELGWVISRKETFVMGQKNGISTIFKKI